MKDKKNKSIISSHDQRKLYSVLLPSKYINELIYNLCKIYKSDTDTMSSLQFK